MRFLHSEPNECEVLSARRGRLSAMNYRLGCGFLLSSRTDSEFKRCFIKVKLLHYTPHEVFPKRPGCISHIHPQKRLWAFEIKQEIQTNQKKNKTDELSVCHVQNGPIRFLHCQLNEQHEDNDARGDT